MKIDLKDPRLLGVVGFVAAGGLAGWLVNDLFEDPEDSFSRLINEAGFIEVIPPADFFAPGTILTVEVLGPAQVRLHPTCTVGPELLAAYRIESASVDRDQTSALEKEFRVGLGFGSGSAEGGRGQDVTAHITLVDVKLHLISTEDLMELREKVFATQEHCDDAIVHNLEAGAMVCQAEQAYMANVRMRIDSSEDMTFKEEAEAIAAFTAELGTRGLHTTIDEQSGDDLYFGVRLTDTGIFLNRPEATPVSCRSLNL